MAQLKVNRFATLAAVYSTAAVVVLACSSTSGAPPFTPPSSDDASSMNMGADAGGGGEDATEAPVVPCDGGLMLPTGSAKGGACSDCMKKKCMQALSTCEMDCVCTRSFECVVVNNNNYTMCAEALNAIGAGNKGLMAIQGCLPGSCPICNEQPD